MRYILGVIGMIVLGIIAVILFGNAVSNNGGDQPAPSETTQTTKTIDHINDKSRVQFTKYGNINSNEDRRTLKIYVSQNERVIEVLDGYTETVRKRQTYSNNYEAYKVFMYALDKAGFTSKKETKVSNPTGICPKGYTYYYKLSEAGNDLSNLWNSSCKPLGGDLGTNGSDIRELFTSQIPDYSEFVQGVSFN
ncbi:MAG: hypothetical protein U0451_03365 [Candidatus Saccharimonadales bacterium]